MESASKMDVIQKAMGPIGRWHVLICGVIFLLKFPVAWHQMSIIFLEPPMDYECYDSNGVHMINVTDKCSSECVEKIYDRSIFEETITTEWDLVCDRKYLGSLSQTIAMFGILIGNIVFGTLADTYGRRIPLVVAVLLQLVSAVATAFTPWFWLFCVLRFITAVATGGTMVASFVIIMEIIDVKWRELVGILYQIPFNLGHLTLPAFAYYLRDWHQLQFALSIYSVVLVSYYWLVPESPRWLFTVGKIDESVKVLERAAKCNRLPTESIAADVHEYAKLKNDNNAPQRGNALDLLRTPNMRSKTLCIWCNWFVCGLAFYGVAQYIGRIKGDIFTNVAISAVLELPGSVACIYFTKQWGRRWTLIFANSLTGIVMVAIAFVPEDQSFAIVTLASIGIIGMSIAFPTVYLYAGELFPTVVRNIGVGSSSMIARIGSMLAPFVAGLSVSAHWLPPIVFGVVPLIGAITVSLLPETMGQPLPETIADGENFGKKK